MTSIATGKSGYSLGTGGSGPPPCDCEALEAEIASLEEEVSLLEAEVVSLQDQITDFAPNWRSFAFNAPVASFDPSALFSGVPTLSGGVVSATINPGIVAANINQGAALVWPLVDINGQSISDFTGLGGYFRIITPLLPAAGTGLRMSMLLLQGNNPAAGLGGYGNSVIPHATTGDLAGIHNGTGAGTWTVSVAGTAATPISGVLGGWQRLPGGSSLVYRNMSSSPLNSTGAPIYVTGTGVTVVSGKTIAQFVPDHVAIVFTTTLALAAPTSVQVSPQAQLIQPNHTDFVGVAP